MRPTKTPCRDLGNDVPLRFVTSETKGFFTRIMEAARPCVIKMNTGNGICGLVENKKIDIETRFVRID